MQPNDKFFQVTISITSEPDDKGKQKVTKETILVDAPDVTGAERKVMEEYGSTMTDWEIVAVVLSKVSNVI